MAELLLDSEEDLEAVASDVEKLLQQAKEADPANFEHLQVAGPLLMFLDCVLAVLGGPGPFWGTLYGGGYGRPACTAHLCCCSAALIRAEHTHLLRRGLPCGSSGSVPLYLATEETEERGCVLHRRPCGVDIPLDCQMRFMQLDLPAACLVIQEGSAMHSGLLHELRVGMPCRYGPVCSVSRATMRMR